MKHCILVKYNETVTAELKQNLPAEVQTLFDQLLNLEGISKVEVIRNVIDRSNRYDLLIRIEMTPETLPAYDESEPHKLWKKNYAQYLEKKAIFDYE